MLGIYFLFCLFILFFSKTFVSKKLSNPINVYTIMWFLIFFIHESNFIKINEISEETFIIIIVAHFFFAFGGCFGFKLKCRLFKCGLHKRNDHDKKRLLKKILVITSLIAAIGVVNEFYNNNLLRGSNVVENFAMMYKDQLEDDRESNFSLESLVYVITPLLGVYAFNYGLEKFLLIPLMDLILFGLSNGSRGPFIILMFLLSAFLTLKYYNKSSADIDRFYDKNKKNIIRTLSVFCMIIFVITLSRNDYETNVVDNPIVVFLVTYLAGGISGLDQFINSPNIVYYPQYFFRVPFILFNKLDITHIDTFYTVPTFYIPFPTNVYTYIGELIHDFGYFFFIPCFFLGYLSCRCYYQSISNRSFCSMIIYSGLFSVIGLSFFANFIHVAALWYVFILGGGIGYVLDNKIYD